ncbi:16S rRNA (cytosine(967)-C(5))-methyltransferase RsmB [Bacillus piscicola]|uniref:16S rRNA (cytosine(967)-C(5))-methyltransferase RsmB n=1 Tax=Bacillus piscicola TaxID=1632684 RepID=UPI001F093ACF|nr:16S rRNA (cytosine(967)-C(5))-methyltransferase RsmB [Bacillus piscicola]
MKNVREEAIRLLERVEREGAYSNLLLNHVLKSGTIAKKDAGLLTELVYGTLKRKNTLDFYLDAFIKKELKSLENWVLQLLRVSLYQLVYLDRIPDRAVVHEAVNIAKKKGHKGISSLVNGVLRSILRQGLPEIDLPPLEKLAVETSHPVWLLEDWIHAYGEEKTKKMALKNLEAPHVSVRVNTLKAEKATVKEKLDREGCQTEEGALAPEALRIVSGNVVDSQAYAAGFCTVQDESSMLPARLLHPEAGMHVLDACAAPGGKTTQLAELMKNEGDIRAFDLHEKKVHLITEQSERLGLTIIHAEALDARKLTAKLQRGRMDRVLVDAPCSGLGVIRRKPEIKWQKTRTDLERFPVIQLEILKEASHLLKSGGRLVYSTCTVRKEENEDVIEAFLKEHPEFERDVDAVVNFPAPLQEKPAASAGQVTILPHDYGTDGFFMAALKKKDER